MIRILMLGIFAFFTILSANNEAEKNKIAARLQQLSQAVNQGKLDNLGSFWSQDATFTRPLNGEVIQGKENITRFLQGVIQEINNRHLQFTFKPEKIDFPTPNTAIVRGVTEITNKGALLRRDARQIELANQSGQWNIVSVKEIEIPPAPPGYMHLRNLEWLIGKWKEEDTNAKNTYVTSWDKFKNFVLQRFKTEVLGVEALEGIQVIGWDPLEGRFRSWLFDSDGGFGNGVWSKQGNSWFVNMNYVLSDGKMGSATNIYTKINDNSYAFASINRKVNGVSLPDLKQVTIVKEE